MNAPPFAAALLCHRRSCCCWPPAPNRRRRRSRCARSRPSSIAPATAPAAATNTPARSAPASNRGSAFASAASWSSGRVDLGDAVKAGQVLAQLDPRDLRLGQDAAPRRRGERRRSTCSRPRPTSSATSDLRDQGFISGAELERRETSLKVAQAQLDAGAGAVGRARQPGRAMPRWSPMPAASSPASTSSRAWSSPPARRCCAWRTTARATSSSRCPRTRSR